MPELPPASPRRVPVNGDAVPAPVISWKSTSLNETAAAVIVIGVPGTYTWIKILRVELAPTAVNVPVTIMFA